jgi:hypothetical protein
LRPFAAGEGLRADDLDGLFAIRQRMLALHHANSANALRSEGLNRLVDEVELRYYEGDALALVEGALRDMRAQQRLSEPRRRRDYHPTLPCRHGAPEALQRALLMRVEGAQCHARHPLPRQASRLRHAAPHAAADWPSKNAAKPGARVIGSMRGCN